MGYNKKILSQATAGLNKAKAPAKKKDRVINPIPLISNEGFKQGPPPEGTNYRIPTNTIYNPTPYNILARASTGEERIIPAGDTDPKSFKGASYVDEFELKKGGQKKSSKKYSRSLSATNKLFDKNPLFKKPKLKKKKIFDPNAKYYQIGGETDSWGRRLDSPWYGFDPDKKQFTTKDQWGRSPGDKWYGFNPDNKTWTKGSKAQQAVENKQSQEERYKTLYEPLENKFYESIETDDDFNRVPVNNQDFIASLFIEDNKRNIPPADPVLKEMQKKLLDLENAELKKLMQKDYSNISLTNFADYVPSNVSYKDALKYINHIQKLKKQGYTFQDGGFIELDLTGKEIEEYKKGGWIVEELPKAQKGGQRKNTYLPGAWANTAPDLIEPGQDAFTYPSSTPNIDPFITESKLATDTSREALRTFMKDLYEGNQRLDQQIFSQRPEYFKSLGKSEKVNPVDQLSIFEYNKLVKLNPNYEKELKDQGYFINKNNKRGFVELYPSNEVVQDIIYSTIDHGQSVEQALKQLEKRGYGSANDIKKQLGEESVKKINEAVKQYYAFNPNYIPPYRTGTYAPGVSTDFGKVDTSVNLKDKWKDNDIITLARDKDFIDSFDINNFDASSPNATNNPAWNSQVVAKLRSGEWGWKPKTNELVKLSKSEAYKPLSIGRKSAAENLISQAKGPATGNPFTQMGVSAFWNEQEALTNRAKDYNRLGADEWQQKYAPSFQQMQERWQTGKTPIEISEEAAYRPKRMLKDNQYYQYGFEQPIGVDPITGQTITRNVSPEEYAGQTVYMSPEESEKYNREMLGQNREQFMTSPMYYLPGAIASGALLGPGGLGRAALNYAPIKSLPGLNLGNAFNAEFAYQAFKDDGFAEQAYDAALKGDKGEALLNLGLTGLAAQPYAKGARSLYNIGKGLSTPGSLQTIATNLPFSAAYKSPIGSGLALQNPIWSSATKEILPGLTSRFNRTLGPTLGEFKFYGTGTQPIVKNPNLLTGSTSAVNQIPGGRYAELPTGRKEYTLPPETVFTDSQLNNYAFSAARDRAFPPYRPGYGFSTKGLNEIADAEFKTFSPGWQAQQELSNLATFGKQPLLKSSDFATEREMEIDRLFYNNRQGIDPDSKDFSAFMKEAEEKGFTPDEVLKRVLTNLGNKVDPARQSQRNLLDQLKPFNLDTRNRDIIRQGNYRPFSKELNEFGPMGGKPAISFGTSGEFDQYYWDQIKRHEDFLTGDYNLSPEQREKIQSKLNSLYQKGVKQGTQSLGIDLQNPWNYKPGLSGLSPNQYGGELPEAQVGGITKVLKTVSKLDDLVPKQLSLFSDADFLRSSISPSVRNMSGFTMPQIENRLLPEYKNLTEEAFKNSVFSPSGKLHPAPQYARADLYNVFSNPKPQYSMPLNEYVNEFNSRLDILNDIIERNNMSGIPYEVTELTDDGFLRFNSPRGRSSFATRIQPGSFTRENLEEVIDPIYWRNIPGIEMSDTSYGVFGEIANPPRGTNSYRSLNEYLKQQQLGRIKSGFNAQSEAGLKAWEKFVKNNEAHGYFDEPNRMYGIFRKEGGKL